MGTADECSVVSLRTLARARDQLEASAGVCSRQMALSDLAPRNCARHVTLGGTAEARAPRVASRANSVGPRKNRMVAGGCLLSVRLLHYPLHGFMGRLVGGPCSLATAPALTVTCEAFRDLPAPQLWSRLTLRQHSWPCCSLSTPATWLPLGLCTCCSLCLACSSSCYLHGWLSHFLSGLSPIVSFSLRPFLTTLSKTPGCNSALPLSPSKRYFLPSHVLGTRCFICLLSVSPNPTKT